MLLKLPERRESMDQKREFIRCDAAHWLAHGRGRRVTVRGWRRPFDRDGSALGATHNAWAGTLAPGLAFKDDYVAGRNKATHICVAR